MLATGVAGAEVPGAIQLAGVGELRAALVLQVGHQARGEVVLEGQRRQNLGIAVFAVQIRHRRFGQYAAVGGKVGQIFRFSRLMHHAHAGNNGEVVAIKVEVDLILDKATEV